MKILIDKEGAAWAEFGPRWFDWGLLLLCVLNLAIVTMLLFRTIKLQAHQVENRERIDVIYKVITVER